MTPTPSPSAPQEVPALFVFRSIKTELLKRNQDYGIVGDLILLLEDKLTAAESELETLRRNATRDQELIESLGDRAEKAEAELAALRHEKGPRWAELQRAESELTELRKDKARLDWLDKSGYLLDMLTYGANKPHPDDHWICTDGDDSGEGQTVRAAIDAALNQREGEK